MVEQPKGGGPHHSVDAQIKFKSMHRYSSVRATDYSKTEERQPGKFVTPNISIVRKSNPYFEKMSSVMILRRKGSQLKPRNGLN